MHLKSMQDQIYCDFDDLKVIFNKRIFEWDSAYNNWDKHVRAIEDGANGA